MFEKYKVYQRAMFYASQFGSEVGKPLRFITETLQVATYLTVIGFIVKPYMLVFVYIFILLAAIAIGRWLAYIGIVKYNTTLNNNHNPELQRILQELQYVRAKIDGEEYECKNTEKQ